MEFDVGSKKITVGGDRVQEIRLEEGKYDANCISKGSNPAADVKIYLDGVEKSGTVTTIEDKDRTEPPQAWNVQNKVTLDLDGGHKGKILKCVSVVHNDDGMKAEMSYLLVIYSGKYVQILCK